MSSKKNLGSVMVVGGGIAGIQASLDLADSGYKVFLVEKKSAIGGIMAQLDKTFPTNDCSMCIISPKLVEAGRHLDIELLTLTEVESINGEYGNFKVKLKKNPRFVDLNKCTSCGECSNICPIEVYNDFDINLSKKKAAFKLYPQAMPGAYTIEKKGTAPCKVACPTNPSLQGCIALMNEGKYKEAFELFHAENPLPGICGRVCHHPCEEACTRSIIDKPISIMALHRFLADWVSVNYKNYIPKIKNQKKIKVGIIGSGPAGLSCAYFLTIQGFKVTIFEKNKLLGGMLTLGIPPYRLPKKIINEEIKTLKKIGIEFQTETSVGADITIEGLRNKNYKAFFIAIGAHKGENLNFKNNKIKKVLIGIEYLYKINTGLKVELGNNVAIIGGGNVAIDTARTALREGSKNPFIIYRRSMGEMPANKEEIKECLEEGIKIKTLVQPVELLIINSKLVGLKCIKMKLGNPDESGRKRPIPIQKSEFIIKTDSVISAIGQKPSWENLLDNTLCELTQSRTIKINSKTSQTNEPDIFAGGDAVVGPSSVIEAIASGKKSAKYIKKFLLKEKLDNENKENKNLNPIDIKNIDLSNKNKLDREKMPLLSPEKRNKNINREVQLGLSTNQVKKEIKRCLACGICSECYQCVKKCLAEAINHSMGKKIYEINVGAIILSPGFTPFNPKAYESYSYGNHANILTSLEFERILSASGPYKGHLIKPSNNNPPKKIAWIQCVGSRDINNCNNEYCSSVCCMYANKQAIIAKEHSKNPLDTVIFYMDMRTFGKDFDKYSTRGQQEYGIRHVRSRIHSVLTMNKDQLKIIYANERGILVEEIFDIVVLSIGMSPSNDAEKLARIAKIDLNKSRFAKTSHFNPLNTNCNGIYVCGSFQEPKDIPSSVIEASASSALASELLSNSRWTLTQIKNIPPEKNIVNKKPKVGVFICSCGINIGGIADVPSIREYASSLKNVYYADNRMFACSQDSQEYIKKIIVEKSLNRIVVASCSPRTHELLFQETIRDTGLNKYLFEMANIRDQNTWVHMNNPEKATQKAKDLVRMAVANVVHNEPLHQISLNITKRALIIGGGISGIESALSIVKQGCEVVLVEKSNKLGGNANYLNSAWENATVKTYLSKLIFDIQKEQKIKVYLESEIIKTRGSIGNFITSIQINKNLKQLETIKHGVIIIAVGGEEFKTSDFLYGKNKNIYTHLDLDLAISKNKSNIINAKNIAFIQCVGSRNKNRPYCSKVCCTHSLKTALFLKKINPKNKILILYRDIRSYGFREKLYKEARKKGILFSKYEIDQQPVVLENKDKKVKLEYIDNLLDKKIIFKIDLLVLATGIKPYNNKKLCQIFKLPINNDGFFVEAHAKLRPVDFSSDGIFLTGIAHAPKPIEESINQSKAAAARAMRILAKENITVGGIVADINSSKCAACLTCVRTCPYGTPDVKSNKGHAEIEISQCHGCGMCASECPNKAISLKHFTDKQLDSKAKSLFS